MKFNLFKTSALLKSATVVSIALACAACSDSSDNSTIAITDVAGEDVVESSANSSSSTTFVNSSAEVSQSSAEASSSSVAECSSSVFVSSANEATSSGAASSAAAQSSSATSPKSSAAAPAPASSSAKVSSSSAKVLPSSSSAKLPASSASVSSSSVKTQSSSSANAPASSASNGFFSDNWRQACLDKINEYRATEGLEPLALAPEEKQTCTDKQAGDDLAENKAHGHFRACDEWAQNSGPNFNTSWRKTAIEVSDAYLKMMWEDEKALVLSGERDPNKDEDYSYIGHYLNMKGNYKTVACGIALTEDGKKGWFNVNFF